MVEKKKRRFRCRQVSLYFLYTTRGKTTNLYQLSSECGIISVFISSPGVYPLHKAVYLLPASFAHAACCLITWLTSLQILHFFSSVDRQRDSRRLTFCPFQTIPLLIPHSFPEVTLFRQYVPRFVFFFSSYSSSWTLYVPYPHIKPYFHSCSEPTNVHW